MREDQVIKVIKQRESVRSFKNNSSLNKKFALLEEYIATKNEEQCPFGNKINVQLINSNESSKKMKLGTYGRIKGAKHYLAVSMADAENNLLSLGFLFEDIILYATSLGLGTVWMSATFSRKAFENAITIGEDEELVIIAPIGIKAKKASIISKIFVKNNRNIRYDFNELFFNLTPDQILTNQRHEHFMQALEMVRLAPSALNMQPWRVIKCNRKFHFYSDEINPNSQIDIGIALAHFDITMRSLGHMGEISFEQNDLLPNYVVTWTKIY